MKTLVTILSLAVLLSHPGAVFALEIIVSSNGNVMFSEDQVLGKTTESAKSGHATQTIVPGNGKQIQINPKARNLEVKLIDKQTGDKQVFTGESKTETNRLQMEIPLDQTDGNTGTTAGETKTYREKYQAKLKAERQQRSEEKLQVRNIYAADGEAALEMESGRVQAKLNGAQFTYDPETDTVTLTTPSGNVHILKHMPDQAIARMRVITNTPIPAEPSDSLEIDTGEDGGVIYTTNIRKNKKFLGLFNRTVETEVTLNDETGEVTETEQPEGIIDQVLNTLSI